MALTEMEIIRYIGYTLLILFVGPVALVAIFNITFLIWMTFKEFKNEMFCKITGKPVIDTDNNYDQLYIESVAWMEKRD